MVLISFAFLTYSEFGKEIFRKFVSISRIQFKSLSFFSIQYLEANWVDSWARAVARSVAIRFALTNSNQQVQELSL